MDYEQKYKEALERARKIHNDTEFDYEKGMMEEVFPELKESEDERIREWLIGYFNQYIIDGMPQVFGNGLNVKDVIAWLEKQGEQKHIDMSIKEKARQIAWETSKHYDPLLSKESWCEMAALDMASWLEKQGKQKPADNMVEVLRTEYEKGRADAIAEMQKPAWSEEDEVKINRIVACLENLNVVDNDILLKDVDWLKSLKQRIGG